MMRFSSVFAAVAALLMTSGAASACVSGTKCIQMEPVDYAAPFGVGDTLPRGEYQVLLNSAYHGLPASDGTFWYFRVDRHVLKVHPGTMEVLDDVTSSARRLAR